MYKAHTESKCPSHFLKTFLFSDSQILTLPSTYGSISSQHLGHLVDGTKCTFYSHLKVLIFIRLPVLQALLQLCEMNLLKFLIVTEQLWTCTFLLSLPMCFEWYFCCKDFQDQWKQIPWSKLLCQCTLWDQSFVSENGTWTCWNLPYVQTKEVGSVWWVSFLSSQKEDFPSIYMQPSFCLVRTQQDMNSWNSP